ncbi:hypothetical protein X474_27145 [Dethiosulfatarculus sandiegensis]|uniref:Uncharacterized protein n=1 Tax=Dethiosulfatarculus sandiegensis TaxID=1429043 RepID=A0A0D2JNH1_9BACT|nr:hypothetical protein X474_27145 [Dethiosulfatarculus sandiegensis]
MHGQDRPLFYLLVSVVLPEDYEPGSLAELDRLGSRFLKDSEINIRTWCWRLFLPPVRSGPWVWIPWFFFPKTQVDA